MIKEEALFHLKTGAGAPNCIWWISNERGRVASALKPPIKEEQFQLQVEADASGMLFML